MGGFARGKRQRYQEQAAGVKRRLFFRLTGHDGAIDLKAPGLGDHLMEAERFIQHLRIRQEGVGDNAQLAAAVQMANRAAISAWAASRLVCRPSWNGGLEMIMSEATIDLGEDVAGKHIASQAVGGKRRAAGFNRRGR
ncbi:Uncharacterised protein [Klebsiella pneumoniae]|uniref:Uncharacterized protein n=1 Tax=Klebsiella pneumoniae TaxID=573 RepID=A0A378FUH8_KLEPN|nr:Uncharacterised protein [Klebsiella pneumoniae]